MGTKYELPEKVNKKLLGTLEREVEMKTFKTNVVSDDWQDQLVKVICVGDYTGGVGTKGVFIEDYLQQRSSCRSSRPPPVDVKIITRQRKEETEPISVRLQLLGNRGEGTLFKHDQSLF